MISLIVTTLSCNLRDGRTVIYVDGTPEIDSTTHYAIRFDKEGNVIDEYKSEGYKKLQKNFNKALADSHLYKIVNFNRVNNLSSNESNIEGKLIAPLSDDKKQILLRGEGYETKVVVNEEGIFTFSKVPLDSYHLFVSDSNEHLTLIEEINLEEVGTYQLVVEKRDK